MRAWDFLFLSLVIVPLVTGGVWIDRPGLHLEYTQPGLAAALLIAWLWWRELRGKSVMATSLVCRLSLSAWERWRSAVHSRPGRTLGITWILVSLLWFTTAALRHLAFRSGLADLGIFTNAIWNVAPYGFPYSSLKGGISLLADHQNYLLYPLGWIYPLWPSPLFLLLLQSIGLSSGGVALSFLARQRLGDSHPAIYWLPIAYWLCGPLRAANIFDFHPEVFLLPLFLFAIFFLQEKSSRAKALGWLFFLGALAAKESAGPVACGIGLAWLVEGRRNPAQSSRVRLGILAMASGLLFFFVDSRVPAHFGAAYSYTSVYEPLGPSPLAIAFAPILHPLLFFGRVLGWTRWKFFFGTLLPFGFIPLLAPAALLAAAPGFLMLFLTAGNQRVSLGFHYAIEPLVGILFALPVAMESPFLRGRTKFLMPALLLGALLSYGRSEVFYWRQFRATPHQAWLRDSVLPLVDPERSVSASSALVPHLANRHWVQSAEIPYVEKERLVDCFLLESTVNNTPMGADNLRHVQTIFARERYQTEFRCGTFSLQRRPGAGACLITLPFCSEHP